MIKKAVKSAITCCAEDEIRIFDFSMSESPALIEMSQENS